MMPYFPSTHKSQFLSLFLIFAVLGGCASKPKHDFVEQPQENVFKGLSNHEVLLKESRAEASRLRSELAAMRIAAAKQSADLQYYQGTRGNFREKEKELASENQSIKTQISKLQEERDQLRRQNAEFQARSAAIPEMRQLVMDLKALQTSVHQMTTSMQTLSNDIVKIKLDIVKNEKRLLANTPKHVAQPVTPPPTPPRQRRRVTVEHGDTLWSISQAHGISVQQLKEMNDLTTDIISVDQQLEVPTPAGPSDAESQAVLATNQKKKKATVLKKSKGEQNTKEGP